MASANVTAVTSDSLPPGAVVIPESDLGEVFRRFNMGAVASPAPEPSEPAAKPDATITPTPEPAAPEAATSGAEPAAPEPAAVTPVEPAPPPPDPQEEINRRVAEATRALTERVADLDVQVKTYEAKLKEQTAAPPAAHPLEAIDDPAQLDEQDRLYQDFEDWAIQHWDGYRGDDTPQDPDYAAADIRARYSQIKRARETVIPAVRQRLQAKAALAPAIQQVYPNLFKAGTPEQQLVQKILTGPDLRQRPEFLLWLGDAIRGENARMAELKAKTNPPKPAPVPPKVPAPTASAAASVTAPSPKRNGQSRTDKLILGGNNSRSLAAQLMEDGIV